MLFQFFKHLSIKIIDKASMDQMMEVVKGRHFFIFLDVSLQTVFIGRNKYKSKASKIYLIIINALPVLSSGYLKPLLTLQTPSMEMWLRQLSYAILL